MLDDNFAVSLLDQIFYLEITNFGAFESLYDLARNAIKIIEESYFYSIIYNNLLSISIAVISIN
jgi:hypothetical protein